MTIEICGRKTTLPESWNDLSREQMLRVYALLSGPGNELLKQGDDMAVRIEVTKIVLNLSDDFLEVWEQDVVNANPEAEDAELIFLDELRRVCLFSTQFLLEELREDDEDGDDLDFEEEDTATLLAKKYGIRATLTRNFYPKLNYQHKGKNKRLYGPGENLDNLTIAELAQCFTIYEDYLAEQTDDKIDLLLATMYRPAKPKSKKNKRSGYGGDRRLPFLGHESTVAARATLFAQVPTLPKQLLLFWFSCCRRAILDKYATIFKDPNTGDEKKKDMNEYGWGGVLLALSNGLVDLDKVAAQPFHNVFTYLSYLEDQAVKREMEEAIAKAGA